MDDTFRIYGLKVEVEAGDKPFVCSHRVGDYFLVEGENLVFPEGCRFSMYSLSALLPLLPVKERPLQPNDWILSDCLIACPDPNCGARFRITAPKNAFKATGRAPSCPSPPIFNIPGGCRYAAETTIFQRIHL